MLLPPHEFSTLSFHQSQQNFWHLDQILMDVNTTEMDSVLFTGQHSDAVDGIYYNKTSKGQDELELENKFIKILIQEDKHLFKFCKC